MFKYYIFSNIFGPLPLTFLTKYKNSRSDTLQRSICYKYFSSIHYEKDETIHITMSDFWMSLNLLQNTQLSLFSLFTLSCTTIGQFILTPDTLEMCYVTKEKRIIYENVECSQRKTSGFGQSI